MYHPRGRVYVLVGRVLVEDLEPVPFKHVSIVVDQLVVVDHTQVDCALLTKLLLHCHLQLPQMLGRWQINATEVFGLRVLPLVWLVLHALSYILVVKAQCHVSESALPM
jgi:hypothetical protein